MAEICLYHHLPYEKYSLINSRYKEIAMLFNILNDIDNIYINKLLLDMEDILSNVDRKTEKSIIKYIEENNIELAEEIKASMFVFDDIVRLEDTAIQRILKEVNVKDIAYALKGASNDVSNAIYRNQSQRAAAALKEEIELLGKTKVSQVEESQQNIVNIIRKLEEIGEITLTRGSDEEFVL